MAAAPATDRRAAMLRELELLREQERRRIETPLSASRLWDNPPPRTSQRRAILLDGVDKPLLTLIGGGNRTGKRALLAQWGVAMAAGRDAETPDGRRWVESWLVANQLPLDMIPTGPGRVWVASPSFGAAVEQIRPKLKRWCPAGTTYKSWDDKRSEAEARLPNGGVIISKAYKQYDQDKMSWEGANIRALGLDEQPNSYGCLAAGLSRLVDQKGRALMALTPLRGTADWLYQEIVAKAPDWFRMTFLHGEDNPYIPQEERRRMISAMPAHQRQTRETGAFTAPAGAIFPLLEAVHHLPPWLPRNEDHRLWGADWGARSPHAVWAVQLASPLEVHGRVLPKGAIVAYREHAPRRTTMEPGLPDRRFLEACKKAEDASSDVGRYVIRTADSESPGAFVEAADMGWWVEPIDKPSGSVVEGITLLQALFFPPDNDDGAPEAARLYVTQDCPQLWSELCGMRWAQPKEGRKQVSSDAEPDPECPDHGPDALRYLVRAAKTHGLI